MSHRRGLLLLGRVLALSLAIISVPSSAAGAADDGRLFVVVAPLSDSGPVGVVAFDISSDGSLTQRETYETSGLHFAGAAPLQPIVDPLGRFLLVPNLESDNVTVFSIDADVRLAEVPGSPFSTVRRPVGGVFHPSGDYVYIITVFRDVAVYRVNGNGALELKQTISVSSPRDAAIRPDGEFLYITDGFLGLRAFGIDNFGELTELSGSPITWQSWSRPFEVEISSDGNRLFVMDLDGPITAHDIGADGLPETPLGPDNQLTEFLSKMLLTDDDEFLYVAASQPRTYGFTVGQFILDISGSPFSGVPITTGIVQPPGTSRIYEAGRFFLQVQSSTIESDGTLTVFDVDQVSDPRVPVGLAFVGPSPRENQPPTADAGDDEQIECSGPDGALIDLDGSASSDPDSTPGTNDDIMSFEWYEDYDTPGETFLGEGELISTVLPLGEHRITLVVTDRAGATGVDEVFKVVVDTVAPSLTVSVDPDTLWPPNHRLIDASASVAAVDTCGPATVTLVSVTSDEPDDEPGLGDGHTVDDVQQALPGTADFDFLLRAERAGSGTGRTYTARYGATDAAGNTTLDSTEVFVPHDQGGGTDPVALAVGHGDSGTITEWSDAPGALHYNVIRGDLHVLAESSTAFELGTVTCVEVRSTDLDSIGSEDLDALGAGQGFFYLVEYNDGFRSSYGTESAAKPRFVAEGNCE